MTRFTPRTRGRLRARRLAVPAAAVAVAGAVAVAVAFSANAATLLGADFENGADGWSKSGGSWSVSVNGSHVLRQADARSENARDFTGSASWASYTVQARVKPLSLPQNGSAVALLGRVTGATSYDRVLLTSGRAELQAVHGGQVTVLARIPLPAVTGSWHTVRLQESGRTVSAWVDGTRVGSGTSQADRGRVGVQTLYATADFDDLRVDSSTTSVTPPATPPAVTPPAPAPATGPSTTARPSATTARPSATTASPGAGGTPAAGGSRSGGYADADGRTLGGGQGPEAVSLAALRPARGGGQVTEVTSLAALRSALAGSTQIIRVNGNFACTGDLAVPSHRTILGVGANSGLTGCGLSMNGVTSVVIRNLRIAKVTTSSGTGDAIHVENSDHIWIDHNDLSSDQDHGKDYYDGLVDITRGSDDVTVSWNRLHDHYKAVLIGHSDDNGAEDTGKLHVTLHHNYFDNVSSRMPSLRFGTAHVYDNYFANSSTGSHSRMGAQMLVQNNVYRNVRTPVLTDRDSSRDGFANESGNDIGTGRISVSRTGTFTKAPYTFALDPTASVISLVTAGAGTGHLA